MSNNFPTIKPSLNLQFANTGVLPPDVTFTRASQSGGYYDGVTVSKAEENLFIQSGDLTNGAWTKSNTTIASALGPEGLSNAFLVYPTTTGTYRMIGDINAAALAGYRLRDNTIQIEAKAAGKSWIGFTDSNAGQIRVNFDISTGALGTVAAGYTATITATTAGFFKCIVSKEGGWGASATVFFTVQDSNASVTATTSGTDGIIVLRPQIESRLFATAYTATTTQPITNYIPKMLFAPAGVPVFDHNPVTGEALGLSVWEARTNLLLRSQEFDNAYWNKDSCTVLSNQIIAPDGTLTADKYIPNTGLLPSTASTGIRRSTLTVSSGATYTFSEFAKKGEFDTWATRDNYVSGTLLVINLTTGTIVSNPAFYTNVRVIDCGNGWWRIVYTFVATTTNYVTEAARTNSTGDGYSGIYIWGAQIEAGAFATPYIPTVASTVARSADVAVMTGVNFSRWFNAGAGTLVVEYTNVGAAATAVSANDGTNNNRIALLSRPSTASSNDEFAVVVNGGTGQASLNAISYTTQGKNAISYKANDIAGTMNGAAVRTDTTAVLPVVDRLSFGAASTTVGSVYIRSLAFYPVDLSDANIVAVTA